METFVLYIFRVLSLGIHRFWHTGQVRAKPTHSFDSYGEKSADYFWRWLAEGILT